MKEKDILGLNQASGLAGGFDLDERTSALDEKTEQLVLQRIRKLPGRACIAVTHRPAAAALCDWQMKMEDGQIHAHEITKTP